MRTQVDRGFEPLPLENVVVCDFDDLAGRARAPLHFLQHEMFVLDDVPMWRDEVRLIAERGLDPRPRAFKAPFISQKPTAEVQAAVDHIIATARHLYANTYPWQATEVHSSFRPMITGPEPLHYDSYGGRDPLVTAYINVSSEPRVYGISWNFPQLVHRDRDAIRALMHKFPQQSKDGDPCYALRRASELGYGPLGREAPRHIVRLAPGSIWFFNAKTVSHEVIYGRGAIGIGWAVPKSGAALPPQILAEALSRSRL